jgi:aryl-alcohol dehydrogenase-like predicted oxidoreductase
MSISRREFIETTALGGLALPAFAAPTPLPTRVLGRTGARVSILAFGSGSRFLAYSEAKGIEALNRALDLGITYVDTAQDYGQGESERRVGMVMKTRRKEVFLATKVTKRRYDDAMRSVEGSLKRLQTDHVDLLHIHSLTGEADLAAAEAGALQVLYKMREQKVARAIGITSHSDPVVLKTALERHDFDCTQMALNAALAGNQGNPDGTIWNRKPAVSFQSLALPVAKRKNMGVIAMKVFAQEKLLGEAPVEKLLLYSMSLPVTAAVVGMPKLEYIEGNIRTAKNFKPLGEAEMRELSQTISGRHKLALDRFFAQHTDC